MATEFVGREDVLGQLGQALAAAGAGAGCVALIYGEAGIGETVLLYHDGGKGPPRARRMLTDMTPTQQRLAEIFDIHQYAPTR